MSSTNTMEGGPGGTVDNMVRLNPLTEEKILENIKSRFEIGRIYTDVGSTLVAVNPFRVLPLYTPEILESYKDSAEDRNPPHIYRIADAAYSALNKTWEDQSIIVSGESGAGKTESTKLVLEFLMVMSERSGHSGALNRSRSNSRTNSALSSPNVSGPQNGTIAAATMMMATGAMKKLAMNGNTDVASSSPGFAPSPSRRASSLMSPGADALTDPSLQTLEDQCLYAQTVLEAFGNAKTLRNDNSSRFGKWFEVYFNRSGAIVGANIVTYLLEKSRVVMVDDGERNYHIFYRLLAACRKNDALKRQIFGASEEAENSGGADATDDPRSGELCSEGSYHYLNQSSTISAQGECPVEDFDRLVEAMQVFDISEHTRTAIFRIMVGILHLGNVSFAAKSIVSEATGSTADGCEVVDMAALHRAAMALRMKAADLEVALTSRKLNVGGSDFVSIPYKCEEARVARDALAKAVYAGVFQWICGAMNARLMQEDVGSATSQFRTIGILDIFGFEDLNVNSFEQLCINYCNERLHNHYNEECFRIEQRVYAEEGVAIENIPFVDNAHTLELFEDKRTGVMAMMDAEIYTPNGSNEGFLDKVCQQHASHASFSRPSVRESVNSFKVHHYAGSVSYNTSELLEKCRDFLHADLEQCALSSGDEFMETVIKMRNHTGSHASSSSSSSQQQPRRSVHQRRGSNAKQATLGLQFMQSLGKLMARLTQTKPHFVKCIKPNGIKSPECFMESAVMAQLRYSGLLSLCQLRQIGFPSRMTHAEFVARFGIVVELISGGGAKLTSSGLDALLAQLGSAGLLVDGGWLVGHTRVLMKQQQNDALETELRKRQDAAVVVIQANVRRWAARRRYQSLARSVRALREAMSSAQQPTTQESMRARIDALEFALNVVLNHILVEGRSVLVHEVKTARAMLESIGEELSAVDMLMAAIAARDTTGLTHAIAFASRMGPRLAQHPQLAAAQSLLARLGDEERVVAMVREAVLSRDVAKLQAALSMDAAQELLRDRRGAIYEEVNEGRIMLQRLLAEKQLASDYVAAVGKGDAARVEVLRAEMAAFGMQEPEVNGSASGAGAGAGAGASADAHGGTQTPDGYRQGLPASSELRPAAAAGMAEAQQKVDADLHAAILTGDEALIHECMNAAINIGLQGSESVRLARDKLKLTHQHERLMAQMCSVANVIRVKLKSVLGIETQEVIDLEHIMNALEEFESDLSEEERASVEDCVRALNAGKRGVRAMADMRVCLERNDASGASAVSTNDVNDANARTRIVADYEVLSRAVAVAREMGMKCLMLSKAETLLATLEQQNSHISAMNASSSMSQIVKIAIAPRWRIDRYKQLRNPANYARSLLFNKKRCMESMLKYSRETIPTSLTQLPLSKVKAAVACFKGLLGFTGTKKTTFPASFGHHILSRALNDVDLRDEVFLQIVKQMHGNPDVRSLDRCWLLMCLCVSAFGPTAEFELYLINFLVTMMQGADEHFSKYCTYCLDTLESELDVDEDHLNDMIYKRSLPSINDLDELLQGKRQDFFMPRMMLS